MLVIIFVSFIQFIFEFKILLFGNSILIFFNHSFIETLTKLLPISVVINFLKFLEEKTKKLYHTIQYFTLFYWGFNFNKRFYITINKNFILESL